MRPVTVALLATLLPAAFLAVSLLCLSTYLYSRLRVAKARAKDIEDAATKLTQPAEAPLDLHRRIWEDDQKKRPIVLSDATKPNWMEDLIYCAVGLNETGSHPDSVGRHSYRQLDDETWAADLLKKLNYNGGLSTPALLQRLGEYDYVIPMAEHVVNAVVFPRLSLEGDPEDSLLPFTPEVHRGLRDFFKALEGIKLCPEITKLVSKIPFQLAEDYANQHISHPGQGITSPVYRVNKKVYDRLSNILRELLGPAAHPGFQKMEPDAKGVRRFMTGRNCITIERLENAVELYLRMIASRQRFEVYPTGKTTADAGVVELCPALRSWADEDGMPLEEPIVLFGGDTWNIAVLEKAKAESKKKEQAEAKKKAEPAEPISEKQTEEEEERSRENKNEEQRMFEDSRDRDIHPGK